MNILYWSLFTVVVYCYAGLPLIAVINGLAKPRKVKRTDFPPGLTIIVAAYNEEQQIQHKIDNTFASNYPSEKIQLIIASDGSTDQTSSIVNYNTDPRIVFLNLPRKGKNATLNSAVKHAAHEILVFTDADVSIDANALSQLASHFSEADVGCVAGNFQYIGAGTDGESTHWNIDRWAKKRLSRSGSITSATGALYAIRKSLFRNIPDGVTDDFYISTLASRQKKRILFDENAISFGNGVNSTGDEFTRKVRIAVAGLKGVWHQRKVCNPMEFGMFAVQLFTHKVARRLGAIPIIIQFFVLSAIANTSPVYMALFVLQLVFHLLALTGFLLRNRKAGQCKIFALPYFIDMVLWSGLVALYHLILSTRMDLWVPDRNT